MVWRTTADDLVVNIPTEGSGYDYSIDWGDGSAVETEQTGDASHTYAAAGDYTVTITGAFPRIYFFELSQADRDQLREVSQWGSIAWQSMELAFFGASNLQITATGAPDLSGVTNISSMFRLATSFTGAELSGWNVSNVTDMGFMFLGASAFNGNISNWEVGNVTTMRQMFINATSFNQDLSGWKVGNVTAMNTMFLGASAFNGNISTWDVSSVTTMQGMFSGATSFNQDLSGWKVGNVTSMTQMFKGATSFNGNISTWDVSSIITMQGMFSGATSFNQDLSGWKVGNVTAMNTMFLGASAFNGNISTWDVSSVITMQSMFSGATSFNQDLSGWKVGNVTSMNAMFFGLSSFNGDLSNWDVGNVTNMGSMFNGATSFNADLSRWDVGNVTNMGGMFNGATSFNGNISTWEVGNATSMGSMFSGASLFNQDLSRWDVGNVTNVSSMFSDASLFNGNISTWEVGNVTTMWNMFNRASTFNQDLSNWDVGNVTTMWDMFNRASTFNQDLSGWDVSNVASMRGMFSGATSFNADLSRWDVSGVTNMREMFTGATSFNGDISTWDVSNVTEMRNMISGTNLSTRNYDALLYEWSQLDVQENVRLDAGINRYCEDGETGKNTLMGSKKWNISDSGRDLDTNCKRQQTITFATIADKAVGDADFDIAATASSGLEVTLMSSDPAVATVSATTVTIVSAGTTMLTATQAGGVNSDSGTDYFDATPVAQTLTVNQMQQTITFEPIEDKAVGDADFEVVVSASSGLEVALTSSDITVATVSGKTVTLVGMGTTRLTATQAGNDNFVAADPVTQTLTVSNPFKTVWRTTADGLVVNIPTEGSGYDYSIDWGDGSAVETEQTGDASHTYAAAGDYTVTITGAFPRIYFFELSQADRDQLRKVSQWGSIAWQSMELAFFGASNLQITATDAPDLSGVTSMASMFFLANSFNGDLSTWDVSNVTDMANMFNGATAFNQDLSGWNTCKVSSFTDFSTGATAWTSPMPDFTPCSSTQQITGDAGWRLLSLPKTGGTVADIDSGSDTDTAVQGVPGGLNQGSDPNFVIYDATGEWESPVDISTPWGDGYGFALYFYNNTDAGSTELPLTLDATGAEPSSDVRVALNATVPVSGSYFTLAGNPFNSGFDASAITSTGSGIQNNVHFWDNAMGSYSAQDRTMPYIVSPWQGFWVEVLASNTGPTTGITLPTSGRTDAGATGTFFSKEAANRGDIAFALSSQTTHDGALRLSFRETATRDHDVHDASKLRPLLSEYATMAFNSNGVLKSVESLPWELTEAITVPMEEGLVGVSGSFTLAWEGLESVPAAWGLTFHDYDMGINLDMRSVSEYTFDAAAPVAAQANPLSILAGPAVAVQKSKTTGARFAVTVTPNVASIDTEGEDRASVFALEQNYPNPFNPSTVINYSVANRGKVSLSVYNLLGQKVAQLVNETKTAGNYNVTWNATAATSGVYYYRLETGGQALIRKMMLIK